MDTRAKNEFQKLNLLFERMNNHYTQSQVEVLNEIKGKKTQVSRDEILDILDKLDQNGGGRYVSITYVKPISIRKTKRGGWDSQKVQSVLDMHKDLSDKSWYNGLNDFNSDQTTLKKNPIASIVVAQRYLMHWTTPENYKKAYGEYSEKLHNLRMKYGADTTTDGVLGDNHNQREQLSGGEQLNQTGKLSRDFNMVDSKVKTTNYIVDNEGHIIEEIPGDVVNAISSAKKTYGIEASMQKILQDNPEAIEKYKAEKAEIEKTFKAQNFLSDRILSIVASVDGYDFYYINDKLMTSIEKNSDVYVNQQEMVKIAEEQLGKSFEAISYGDFSN